MGNLHYTDSIRGLDHQFITVLVLGKFPMGEHVLLLQDAILPVGGGSGREGRTSLRSYWMHFLEPGKHILHVPAVITPSVYLNMNRC